MGKYNIMKAFDPVVPFYDSFMRYFRLYKKKIILRWLNLSGTEKILDLGGGTGYNSFHLSQHCKNLIMIDESPAMIKKAQKFGTFKCICCNALETPFNNSSFDIVVLTDMFHHIKNQKALTKEIHRILKPNGKLLLQDFVSSHSKTILLRIFEFFLFGFLYFKSPRQIKKIIISQNFKLEREEKKNFILFQLWKKNDIK